MGMQPYSGGGESRRRVQATRSGFVRLVARSLPSSTANSPKLNSSLGLYYPRVYNLAHLLRRVTVSVLVLPRLAPYDRAWLPPPAAAIRGFAAAADAAPPGVGMAVK